MNQLTATRRTLLGVGTIVLACLLWQFVAPLINRNAIAPFSSSFVAGLQLLSPQMLSAAVLPSLMRILAGFGISAVLGITLGCILGSLPRVHALVRPVFDFLRATPSPIVIPVAIALLGLGHNLVIGIIVFGSIWPVLINTTDAISRVEPQFLDVARVAHLGPVQTMFQVKLPSSLPMILPGLRLTMQLALVLMVTGEMLGASSGLGYQLIYAQQTFDIAGTYGGILILSVIGFALDVLLVALEKKYVRHDTRGVSHGL